jgi:hypothetical protein
MKLDPGRPMFDPVSVRRNVATKCVPGATTFPLLRR